MLALMMVAWRFGAMLERQLVRAAFGVRIPNPYRRPRRAAIRWSG